MATETKYLKLDTSVLLEWVYNDQNLKQENYKVLQNLNTGIRSYLSETGLNSYENNMFPIDTVIRKYAQVDVDKYNFLKLENYAGDIIRFDTLRIHLPSSFSFFDNEYKGMHIRIYAYDYVNEQQYDLSNYYYDDTDTSSSSDIQLNDDFLYDGKIWGKYITFDIPSVEAVSNQRRTNLDPNIPTPNSLNSVLTKGVGLSINSPVFVEFSFISAKSTVLGTTSYKLSSSYKTSVSQSPDFQDVGVTIKESSEGDFFEFYGTFDNDNEEFDDYMDDLISMGRSMRLEYVVSLFEENILMNTYNYSITENFSQKIWYRPIISFSNTTAMINVEMKIIDNIDGSEISRFASLGLTNNIFKYGKRLTKIDISGAFKPKIYNLKSNGVSVDSLIKDSTLQDINLTKVNYPVIADRIKILASSSSSQNTEEFKSMGLAQLILNPFDNYVKFQIAEDVDGDNVATPYNLTSLLTNASLLLVFKSDTVVLEKQIFQETDQNDFGNGIVVFKIEEMDLNSIKTISEKNKDFYLVVKANTSNVRTLLYSGKFLTFDEVDFIDDGRSVTGGFNLNDLIDPSSSILPDSETGSTVSTITTQTNNNALVFLNLDADVPVFEDYLSGINTNIYVKRAGGNELSGSYVYFLLNLSKQLMEDIKIQNGVKEVVSLPFGLGEATSDVSGMSIEDIRNRVTGFNCNN